jgi:hypothetical protein
VAQTWDSGLVLPLVSPWAPGVTRGGGRLIGGGGTG